MIKKLTVINDRNDKLVIDLGRPDNSGLLIYDIEGIGPGKANITTSDYASNDGGIFRAAKMGPRNIVISLRYMFSPTVEQARHRTYKYFPIKKEITLVFETEQRSLAIKGYVEANEPDIFQKESGAQISIICPDPFFYMAGSKGMQITEFESVDSKFEFPIAIEDLVFGDIIAATERALWYDGDADTGLIFDIYINGLVGDITIVNSYTGQRMEIDSGRIADITGKPLDLGDRIELSTIKGSKYVTLIRDGNEINILNCLGKRTDWFEITKGDNVFAFIADDGMMNLKFRLTNPILYMGV